ncbi:MAG TPA: hypothetical protein VGR57_21550, partial [Ktedonobacterales bacterium]|nr:hypothetical protein [Ktedonobacterales bacterium]
SSAIERQQTKWVSLVFIASLTINSVETIAPWLVAPLHLTSAQLTLIFTPVISVYDLLVPFCLGIAITRFHLWSIDIIIRRTLIYGSLTAVLAAAYISVVLLAQGVTQRLTGFSGQQPIVTVGSTLLIAALVAPLRRRIQALIDRAFYRGRYDAALTLADFGARLRTATDLEALREDLMSVVRQTMRPEHVTLWLAQRSRPAAELDMPAPHASETARYPTRANVSASVSSSKSGGWM